MSSLVLHDTTIAALKRLSEKPVHALLIAAPAGAGKTAVANRLAAMLLGIDEQSVEQHPYIKHIRPIDNKQLSIESIRDLQHFMSLKPSGTTAINRIAIIEAAHTMTPEAQNALLKTLEEPPVHSMIILAAASAQVLLPTIRSRVQTLALQNPSTTDLLAHFGARGHDEAAIKQALLMSGGLPGLMGALLNNDSEHPLVVAAGTTREILQKGTFERLAMVDSLTKQRQLTQDILFIMAHMASVAMKQSAHIPASVKRWHRILSASHAATGELQRSAQPKLVLTKLMLTL